MEWVSPRGLNSLWKLEARSWANSHAASGVVEGEHEQGRLAGAGRVLTAKPGALDGPCQSRAGYPEPAVPRDRPSRGCASEWARVCREDGVFWGRAQQVVSRPVQLDQIHAGKALSTG